MCCERNQQEESRMIGGKVIENAILFQPETNRIVRELWAYSEGEGECGVFADHRESESVALGDVIWWQAGKIMWSSPSFEGEKIITKIGYSFGRDRASERTEAAFDAARDAHAAAFYEARDAHDAVVAADARALAAREARRLASDRLIAASHAYNDAFYDAHETQP
jgi:hypothetical protein